MVLWNKFCFRGWNKNYNNKKKKKKDQSTMHFFFLPPLKSRFLNVYKTTSVTLGVYRLLCHSRNPPNKLWTSETVYKTSKAAFLGMHKLLSWSRLKTNKQTNFKFFPNSLILQYISKKCIFLLGVTFWSVFSKTNKKNLSFKTGRHRA